MKIVFTTIKEMEYEYKENRSIKGKKLHFVVTN